MRTAWLLPVLIVSWLPACSDEAESDGNTAGRSGGNAGGAAGRRAAGGGGAAGSGGTAGAAGSAGTAGAAGTDGGGGAAGSDGSSGGAAGSVGAAGTGPGSASAATGCEDLCSRPLVCPGDTPAECLSACGDAAELCPDPFEALHTCGASLSDSDFECVGGIPIPSDLCTRESAAFARCRIGF